MNYFEQMAERQMNGAQKAKERREVRKTERREAKSRGPTPLQLKQIEAAILMKEYRKWRNGIKKEIAERHTTDFAALMRLLRNLSWRRVEDVVDYVKAARWLRNADEDTRFETLRFIDGSFMRSRVREGLPPLDDGLWDEPPGPFHRVRKTLMGY